jgi:hypothetical protein
MMEINQISVVLLVREQMGNKTGIVPDAGGSYL